MVVVHFGGGLWGVIAAPLFSKENGIFINPSILGGQVRDYTQTANQTAAIASCSK